MYRMQYCTSLTHCRECPAILTGRGLQIFRWQGRSSQCCCLPQREIACKRLFNGGHRHIPVLLYSVHICIVGILEAVNVRRVLGLPCLLDLKVEIGKEWKTQGSCQVMAREEALVQPSASGFPSDTLPWQPKPSGGTLHNLHQLSIHGAGGLGRFSHHSIFTSASLLLLVLA